MKKVLMIGLLLCMSLILTASVVKAADLSALPSEMQEIVEDMLATRFPPELHSLTLDPEQPVAGEPTAVSVEIFNDSQITDDETVEVYVFYMVNWSMEWESIELESDDDKNWTGTLPAFESGDEVVYAVHAVDSSNNVFTSVPCTIEPEEDLMTQWHIMEDCVNGGEDLSACEDKLPRACWFRMSSDEEPINDEDDEVFPYGDYVDFRIGYDGDNVYLDFAVESKIDKGKMTPTDIHLYAAAAINPDAMGKDTSIEALLAAGGVMVFSPLLKQFESTGYVSDCFFGYQQGTDFGIDKSNIKCLDKKNHLVYQLSWDLIDKLGDNPSGVVQFLTLSGVVTDISDFSNLKGQIIDYSHVTSAHFTEDTFFVVE